jgi:hypothetical protein
MMPPRPLRWYAIPVRVLLVTFIGTLITFAISLLLGMLGIVILSYLRHIDPNMTLAYRLIALPVAAVAGIMIFALSLAMEIRHYRQSKTLARIERAN